MLFLGQQEDKNREIQPYGSQVTYQLLSCLPWKLRCKPKMCRQAREHQTFTVYRLSLYTVHQRTGIASVCYFSKFKYIRKYLLLDVCASLQHPYLIPPFFNGTSLSGSELEAMTAGSLMF